METLRRGTYYRGNYGALAIANGWIASCQQTAFEGTTTLLGASTAEEDMSLVGFGNVTRDGYLLFLPRECSRISSHRCMVVFWTNKDCRIGNCLNRCFPMECLGRAERFQCLVVLGYGKTYTEWYTIQSPPSPSHKFHLQKLSETDTLILTLTQHPFQQHDNSNDDSTQIT